MKESKLSTFLSKTTEKVFGATFNYRLRYFHQRGHFPNLKCPQDMSEILLSELTSDEKCEFYAPFIDKVLMRDYVKEKGLERVLLKHYGVWDTPEEIPFDNLPDKFVLKSNNGCGNHVICYDKSKLVKAQAIQTLHNAIEYGLHGVEPHYHHIVPKVFAEELIETPDKLMPTDYKFTCVGGEIMDVFVATERSTNTKYCTLDLEWNTLPYTKENFLPKVKPVKPSLLKDMAEIARILSEDFDFVRVDLYEYHNQVYISELTFFPWGALLYSYTDDAIKQYGEKWHASKDKKQNK